MKYMHASIIYTQNYKCACSHVRNCMKFAYNNKREESFLIPPKFLEKKKKNSKEQTKILLPPEEQVFSVLLVH